MKNTFTAEQMCAGRRQFRTRESAEAAKANIVVVYGRNRNQIGRVYKCAFCSYYHLGKPWRK